MKKKKSHIPFTEKEYKNIFALGEVLRGINNRLLKEGIMKTKEGKTVWLEIQNK